MSRWKRSWSVYSDEPRDSIMTTTGELRAIIEELQLIDAGDATAYLGEEMPEAEEALLANLPPEELPACQTGLYGNYAPSSCKEVSFP
jgi:hypothetical protein